MALPAILQVLVPFAVSMLGWFVDDGVALSCLHSRCLLFFMTTGLPQGYAEMVSLLLLKGANPGAATTRHLTPLHLAAHGGHLKVTRLLLEAWAPVDDRDKAGTSPLHMSAQMGHIDVVRLLLQCGADKDGLDESAWAPIHFAVWKGHAAVVRILLQAGSSLRVSCAGSDCPLVHNIFGFLLATTCAF